MKHKGYHCLETDRPRRIYYHKDWYAWDYKVITDPPEMEIRLITPPARGKYPYRPYPGSYSTWWKHNSTQLYP